MAEVPRRQARKDGAISARFAARDTNTPPRASIQVRRLSHVAFTVPAGRRARFISSVGGRQHAACRSLVYTATVTTPARMICAEHDGRASAQVVGVLSPIYNAR